ncbi:acyl-ACP--UDP-N- acetylglucosamine O-acyltransferase [Microbacterium lacus]|uniref:acyl-ACP--UDP-N- acetylglucosamine O-acyltransferase n=1 Tax=Microbacterium lacus TaxID=415217 RepID=UPI00384B13DB
MNHIHPTAVIGPDVRLGRDNTIGPFVVLSGNVEVGDENWIGGGVVIGAPPEVRSFAHPRSDRDSRGAGVIIGSANVIREYAQIHSGLKVRTTVGDGGFLMNQVYVAHDCRIGDNVTLASSVLLAGHVTVGDGANVGLGSQVHQFRLIGAGAMVGMGSTVTRDIPPFAMAYGTPALVRGANRVGLERLGVNAHAIAAFQHAYENSISLDADGLDLPDNIRRALVAVHG